MILSQVKDDRILVIFEESGDWKESWILSTDSIIIRDGMRVTDISSMKIGSFGVMVLDGKLSSSPLRQFIENHKNYYNLDHFF